MWRDVPHVPGTLIINGGDYLHHLRPKFVNPVHRVLCPVASTRTSFVLFYYPGYYSALGQGAGTRDDSGDTAAAVDTAWAGEEYNTLDTGTGFDGKNFGDFIVHKWAGVRRKGY
jgi:hypothetical protein